MESSTKLILMDQKLNEQFYWVNFKLFDNWIKGIDIRYCIEVNMGQFDTTNFVLVEKWKVQTLLKKKKSSNNYSIFDYIIIFMTVVYKCNNQWTPTNI